MLTQAVLPLLVLVTSAAPVDRSAYEVARFMKHYAEVTSVVAAPGGEAVSFGLDGYVWRWDLLTAQPRGDKPVSVAEPDEADDMRLTISPSGDLLAAVWGNNVLYLCVRTYPTAGVFKHGEQPRLGAVAFSPDGKLLASGDANGSLALFDTSNAYRGGTLTVTNKDKVRDLSARGEIVAVAFSPDSKGLLALGKLEKNYALQVLDPASGKLRIERTADGPALAVAPNGASFVAGNAVWNLADAKPRAALRHDFTLHSAVYSPDSKWLVTGGDDNRLIFWDARTGQKLAMIRAHDHRIRSVALTADGKYLISGSDDLSSRVWDVARILAEKPMDQPMTKLADVANAYDAWRMGLCWAQGTRNHQPGKPRPELLAEAETRAKQLGIELPDPPQEVDLQSVVKYLHEHQEPLSEAIRTKFGQTPGELFLAGAFLPTIQMFFDPSNEEMKEFRDEIMPGMSKQFIESFGTLPAMFERTERNLADHVDRETMNETLAMLIRELDLYLEAQAKSRK